MTAPIDPNHHEAMNDVAKYLDDAFNPLRFMTGKRQTGFMLTIFDFDNPEGRFNYISNTDKLDVKQMLKGVINRLDERGA